MRNIKLYLWIVIILILASTLKAVIGGNEPHGHKHGHKHCFEETEILGTIQLIRKQFSNDYNEGNFDKIGSYYTKTDCTFIIRSGDYDIIFTNRKDIVTRFYVQAKVFEADLMTFKPSIAVQLSPNRAYSMEEVVFQTALIGPESIRVGSSMVIWKLESGRWLIEKQVITIPVDLEKTLKIHEYKERDYKK